MDKREWMLQAALAVLGAGGRTSVAELAANYDAICAATPPVADEGWVEHDGDVSKAPAEDAEIEVVFPDGICISGHGGDYAWDHSGEKDDIIRWRYVEQAWTYLPERPDMSKRFDMEYRGGVEWRWRYV